jgi:hypothetical protein
MDVILEAHRVYYIIYLRFIIDNIFIKMRQATCLKDEVLIFQ